MSSDLAHIARCLDVRDQDIAEAMDSRERTRRLLEHLAALSTPNSGAAKVLLVFARMATSACDWLDGDLAIELLVEGSETMVTSTVALGGGLRERVFPPLSFKAPIEEFQRALDRVPHLVAPLAVRAAEPGRVLLTASEAVRRTTMPPPPIEIATESLYSRLVAPPRPSTALATAASMDPAEALPSTSGAVQPSVKDVDSGWDD